MESKPLNLVAKHARKFNIAAVHLDRKRAAKAARRGTKYNVWSI